MCPIDDTSDTGKTGDVLEVRQVGLRSILGGGEADELLEDVDIGEVINGLSDSSANAGL